MKRSFVVLAVVAGACAQEQIAQGNRPPDLKVPGPQVVAEGALLAFTITVSDPDEDPVTLAAQGLPENAVFNAQSGQVLWQPDHRQAGDYGINFSATDGRLTVEASVPITVTDSNRPPELDGLSDLVVDEGTAVAFVVLASDPDEDAVSVNAAPLPDGAIFDNATGLFRWQPSYQQAGPYFITFTATEETRSALRAQHAVTINVRNVNRPPVFAELAPVRGKEGQRLEVHLEVSDPDGDGINVTHTGVPPGAAFEPTSRAFSWTPAAPQPGVPGQAGTYNVNFTATDVPPLGDPRSAPATLVIYVDRANRPPTLDALSDQVLAETETLTLVLHGHDEDTDQALTYRALGLPDGAQFSELDGIFTWTPGCTAAGSYLILFSAGDGQESATRPVTITVNAKNCPPRITGVSGARTVSEGQRMSLVVNIEDQDDERFFFEVSGAPGGVMDAGLGVFTWTPDFDQAGTYELAFSVTDRGAPPLSDSVTETVTVLDYNHPPVFDAVGSQSTFEGELVTFLVMARDLDGDAITDIQASGRALTLDGSNASLALVAAEGGLAARFKWTPTCKDGGSEVEDYPLTFRAFDAKGAVGTTLAALTVKNRDCLPEITVTPPSDSTSEGGAITLQVTAVDPDGGWLIGLTAAGGPMTIKDDGLSHRRASFVAAADQASGTFAWRPACADAGAHVVSFQSLDSTGKGGTTTANINVAPVRCDPALNAPDAVSGEETAPISFTVTAVDAEAASEPALAWSALPDGATVETTSLGLSRGARFSWTPDCTQHGTWPLTFTATGTGGGQAVRALSVTVADVNCAPVFVDAGAANYTAAEAAPFAIEVTAQDPDGDALSAGVTGEPFGILGSDAAESVQALGPSLQKVTFVWTPSCQDSGGGTWPYAVVFTARDALTESSLEKTVFVTNVECAPTLTLDKYTDSTSEGGLSVIHVSASDPDGGPIVGMNADGEPLQQSGDGLRHTRAEFVSPGNHAQGTFTWRPGCLDQGRYPVSFQVMDSGGFAQANALIDVTPAQCPLRVSMPDAVSGEELAQMVFAVRADDPEVELNPQLGPRISWTAMPSGLCFASSGTCYDDLVGNETTETRFPQADFFWTPTCTQAGRYFVDFTFEGTLERQSRRMTIDVADVNCPPTLLRAVPWTAPAEGGRTIALCGENLFSTTSVLFDGSTVPVAVVPSPSINGCGAPRAGTSLSAGPGLTFVAPPHQAPAVVQVSVDTHEGSPQPPPVQLHYYRLAQVPGINWGRMRAVAGSPRNAQLFATAFSGNIFTSGDAGRSWERRGPHPLLLGSQRDWMAIDATTDTTLYTASGPVYGGISAVVRSTDQGRTWQRLEGQMPDLGCQFSGTFPPAPYSGLAPASGGGVLLLRTSGCGEGVWLSPRGGAGWQLLGGLPTTGVQFVALASAPSDPARLVAATVAKTFRSQDAGSTWTETTPVGSLVVAAAFDPQDPRHLFALTDLGGLKETTDLGDSWTDRPEFLGRRALAVSRAADVAAASVYVLGPEFVESSTDNGQTVVRIPMPRSVYYTDQLLLAATAAGAVLGFYAAVPGQPGSAVEPLPSAALRSLPESPYWADASTGLAGGGVDLMVFARSGKAVVLSGQAIYTSAPGSPRRFTRSSALPAPRWVHALVASETTSDTLFALTDGTDWIHRSTDAGASFISISPAGFSPRKSVLLAATPGRVHALTRGGFGFDPSRWMMTSTDEGDSWSESAAAPDNNPSSQESYAGGRLFVDFVQPRFLWFSSATGFAGQTGMDPFGRSADYGATITQESPTGLYLYDPPLIVDRYSTLQPDVRLLLLAGMRSSDGRWVIAKNEMGGLSGPSFGWSHFPEEQVANDLYFDVRSFGQQRPDPDRPLATDVFLAGDVSGGGILASTDRGISWRKAYLFDQPGLSNVSTIESDPTRLHTWFIGTRDSFWQLLASDFGAGVFELQIILP